jgi:hypothetical protein
MVSFVFTQTDASLQEGCETFAKVILQLPLLALKATVPDVPVLPKQSWETLLAWQASQGISFYSPVTLVAGLSTLQVAELKTLESNIRAGVGRTSDRMSRIHLQDALERIDLILNPKG